MPCWFVTPGSERSVPAEARFRGRLESAVFTIVTSALPSPVLYTPLRLHFNFNGQLLRRVEAVKNFAVFASTR